jgi:hypothetical protein
MTTRADPAGETAETTLPAAWQEAIALLDEDLRRRDAATRTRRAGLACLRAFGEVGYVAAHRLGADLIGRDATSG